MRPTLHAVFATALLAAPAAAQIPDDARVRQALAYAARTEPRTIDEQVAICEIESPPFKEARRAADYRRRMEALGLRNVRIDSVGNVIGERPGEPGQPVIVISGHLDTVFPEGTDVRVRREGTLLRGPGIGDDCRGLAVVLAVARAMNDAQIRTRGTVLFVGTVGEEGAGNLRGVRHLFEKELRGRVTHFISVDDTGYEMTKDAVGSYRYRVAYRGPGGHSYGSFGMPNPVHALGRAIARISDFQVPADPKVTFSVGVVEGGTSVNAIAAEASLLMDMRSVAPAALDSLDRRFHAAVRQALDEENARWPASPVRLTVDVERTGTRPAGTQPADAPIVRAARAAGQRLGFDPHATASSTDANIPMSLGIPSLTIGAGGKGEGAHSLAESWDSQGSEKGTQWVLLLVLGLAGVR
ncbi:MAG TPA: M20/M25/M40 family metallo-hydrolase [Longimicrobium sp.]|jgi:acetylornithine deacetylase/succinyl-diaminopimelate desuccinylase-like protein|nr:M20/M25/M40 family metallo-hydrolase [Longimicrobium sp.]